VQILGGAVVALILFGAACSADPLAPPSETASTDFVTCVEPRPEACTREYLPVCAEHDTGIRCVTTPCDSTEWVTRANGCTACSDPKVLRYRPGACSESDG
jgi:hypothetical protein